MEQALKEQEKLDQLEGMEGRDDLVLNPDTMFDERFQAVMVDMLNGKHISQTKPNSPGLFKGPSENETDEDDPTIDF